MLVLAHVDFRAVPLEPHFIHELIDKVDASAMVRKNILADARVGHGERVEAAARVAYDDEHTALLVASYTALDFFGDVILSTMNNGIGERFAKGGFDLEFLAGRALHPPGHLHYALNDRADGSGIGVKRDLDTYHQLVGIELCKGTRTPPRPDMPPLSIRGANFGRKRLEWSSQKPQIGYKAPLVC